MRRIVASVEARMGSSRLPGKVMIDICGKPAIERLFNRLKQSQFIDDVVLATSTSEADLPLVLWAEKNKIPCYRGSEDDVLNRVVKAHEKMNSDIIVEVTGDCTLVDSSVIDMGIERYLKNDCDVVSNTWKTSYPMGVDVQVFSLKLLQEVERSVRDQNVREHVSLYFYEHPEKYKIVHLMAPDDQHRPELRFQLDYPEDLQFIRTVYSKLEPKFGFGFNLIQIIELLRTEPGILEINKNCIEKAMRPSS